MPLKRKPFFYDRQLKRYIVQIMSCFSGYQVITGTQRDGRERFLDVPVIYGDMDRTVGYIMSGGNENTMSYLPIISMYITGLRQSDEHRLNSQHSEKIPVLKRAKTSDGDFKEDSPDSLKNESVNSTTYERFMPVPYDMTFDISFWTSNNDQGFQLIEQIGSVFNPDLEIQLSNSPLDWAFINTIIFNGDIAFNKIIADKGAGTDTDPIYTFTLDFNIVIWLSLPVKSYESKYIHEIQVPILEKMDSMNFDEFPQIDGLIIKADDDEIMKFESFT